jgi:tRNA(His) 5'-end guanylyltransferase
MPDEFGARMKRYELPTRQVLPPRTYTIIRVDGRAFHTYLRGADKPFDGTVIDAMDAAAVVLCQELSGARFAYTQSDEISVLLTDLEPQSQPWFGGVAQKMASVAASIATMAFNRYHPGFHGPDCSATFDGRVYTIPSRIEVANYFLWRQKDAIRNAISMAGQAAFSQAALQGVNTNLVQEMLWHKKNINFKTAYSDRERRGGAVVRETTSIPMPHDAVEVRDQDHSTVRRSYWISRAAPDFTLDNGGFMARWIPQEPADALRPKKDGAFWEDLREDMKDPEFAAQLARTGRELLETPCGHGAWDTTPTGIPHTCSDCGHRFTTAESDERRTWNIRDGV